MSKRAKLLLLIPHLGGGGAERVTSLLAAYLDPSRFEIHLATIAADQPGAQLPPPWVTVHRLNRTRVRHAALPLLQLVRSIQPDAILSNMAHLNFLLLALKPFLPAGIRLLARQNTTASSAASSCRTRAAYRLLYPQADAILCQSPAMADDLACNFFISRAKLAVLPNPIDIPAIRASVKTKPSVSPTDPRLLCVTRLAPEKGVDLLLSALPAVLQRYPSLRLTVLGTGSEEPHLRQLACRLQLNGSLTLAGFHPAPAGFYPQTTLFVLPSRYEGLPNALLEAAAAGLPIAAMPASAGLCDLLAGAPGVWLASSISPESLAETILRALDELSASPPARFEHAFLAPFELPRAIAAYAACIEQCLAQA
jgi:glycosyltransferase involved in cell wall biosynthesis